MPLRALGVHTPLHELKAELFKALAHPLRVRCLELLATGEQSVSALLQETGAEASQLSQHLAVLRRAGVTVSRREGNVVVYRLVHPDVAEFLVVARRVIVDALTAARSTLDGLGGLGVQEPSSTDAGTAGAAATAAAADGTSTPAAAAGPASSAPASSASPRGARS